MLQQLNASGTVVEEYTNAMTPILGIGQLVETNRPGKTGILQKVYPVQDMRGTVTKWIEGDGLTILASQEYDSFGTIIPNSLTGTWPDQWGYQGQTWMQITSMNASQIFLLSPTRLYYPTDGRWVQRDRLRFDEGMNLYEYVTSSPISLTDAWGLKKCCPDKLTWPKDDNRGDEQDLGAGIWKIDTEFHVVLTFKQDDAGGDCCCECCHYRQEVKGFFMKGGAKIDKMLPPAGDAADPTKEVKLSEKDYQEDG